MNRGMKLWCFAGGGLVLCAAAAGAVLAVGASSGAPSPVGSASPDSSASSLPDFVPDPSAELLAYGSCLRGSGLETEHVSGVIIVKGNTSASEVEAAKSDCSKEQRAFAETIESKGEGSEPQEAELAEFQGRLGGCVAAQGITWPMKQRVADRSDPVFLESDRRVPAIRNCVAHNMILPGDGKPSATASS